MALKVIVNSDKKPSGVFIPLEDWAELNGTVKPYSPIYDLMEELTLPQTSIKFREGYVLPSGVTVKEVEQLSRTNVEAIYIDAFLKGIPRYYEDERCTAEKQAIRAMPDGSEDLTDFDWQTGKQTFIKKLVPAGKGKFAYLLHDLRYLKQAKD